MGGVDEGDQVANLALGEGRGRRAGVIGENKDLEGGEVQLGVVEGDGQAGEHGESVIGPAGVDAGGPAMLASCVVFVSTSGRATRPTQRSLAAREWRELRSLNGDESGGESGSKAIVVV